jgi:hypothetical protein
MGRLAAVKNAGTRNVMRLRKLGSLVLYQGSGGGVGSIAKSERVGSWMWRLIFQFCNVKHYTAAMHKSSPAKFHCWHLTA